MLKSKIKQDQKIQKAKNMIAQQKFQVARDLTRQQMMMSNDNGHEYDKDDADEANQTYADYQDSDSDGIDPAQTREEYDSEEEYQYQRKGSH